MLELILGDRVSRIRLTEPSLHFLKDIDLVLDVLQCGVLGKSIDNPPQLILDCHLHITSLACRASLLSRFVWRNMAPSETVTLLYVPSASRVTSRLPPSIA